MLLELLHWNPGILELVGLSLLIVLLLALLRFVHVLRTPEKE